MAQEVIKPEMGKNAAGEDVYMFTLEQLQAFISKIVGDALPEAGPPAQETPPPAQEKPNPLEMMRGMGGR